MLLFNIYFPMIHSTKFPPKKYKESLLSQQHPRLNKELKMLWNLLLVLEQLLLNYPTIL